jgi:hypothetical protein
MEFATESPSPLEALKLAGGRQMMAPRQPLPSEVALSAPSLIFCHSFRLLQLERFPINLYHIRRRRSNLRIRRV